MTTLTLIFIAGTLFVALCSFIYLAVVLVQNWRNNERVKGSPFHVMDDGIPSGHVEARHNCFETCMSRNAWDVDRTSACALECRKPDLTGKEGTKLAASRA